MRAHNNLGVATRAAQLLAPSEVAQMELVIEENPFFKSDLLRQEIRGMATGPQAAGVFDLGVRLGAILFGHELDYGIDGLKLGP